MVKEIKEPENPLLEVELMRVSEIIFGRINKQNEMFRTQSGLNFEHEKVIVCCSGEPQLTYDNSSKKLFLYLRGNYREKDYQTFFCRFKTEDEAKKWAPLLRDAVIEFNKQKGQRMVPPTEPLKCEKIM